MNTRRKFVGLLKKRTKYILKELEYIDNLLEIMQPKQKEITFPSGEELRDIGMVQTET